MALERRLVWLEVSSSMLSLSEQDTCQNEWSRSSAASLPTSTSRSKEQGRLFISYQEGQVKDVTTQTISSYIRQAFILAYENSPPGLLSDIKVQPRSVRSVATSLRAIKSSSLDEVLSGNLDFY